MVYTAPSRAIKGKFLFNDFLVAKQSGLRLQNRSISICILRRRATSKFGPYTRRYRETLNKRVDNTFGERLH